MYLTNNSVYILMKVSKLVRWLSDLINLSCRLAIWRLGRMKLNCSQQNSIICILLVLKSFIMNRFATKSRVTVRNGNSSCWQEWPILYTPPGPALVAEWLTHSAAMCSRAWRAQWPGFDSARTRPPTKELFLIIPVHVMNRELTPDR